MTDWVTRELARLRTQWPDLQYEAVGHWVLLPGCTLPKGWSVSTVDIACQIPPGQEQAPYAFYVNASPLTFEGNVPTNWTASGVLPFAGTWCVFSWAPDSWVPTINPDLGPNMLIFARSFADRFAEGV